MPNATKTAVEDERARGLAAIATPRRPPTVELRIRDMKRRAAMLARFLGAASEADDPLNFYSGKDALNGFEELAESLYTDICAVLSALEKGHEGLCLPAPDADDEGGAR